MVTSFWADQSMCIAESLALGCPHWNVGDHTSLKEIGQ